MKYKDVILSIKEKQLKTSYEKNSYFVIQNCILALYYRNVFYQVKWPIIDFT